MSYTTRKSLLARVRSGDEISWMDFYNTYKPLIRGCGYDCGLSYDEQKELIQQVMCEVFQKDIIGRFDFDNIPENITFQYDPAKGRFRHYLRKVSRYQALKIIGKRSKNISLDDENTHQPAELDEPWDQWDQAWEEEWRRHILTMALEELKGQVQPDTFVAFEMYALQNRPVDQVAAFLNMSLSSVYTAKSRCITALKNIIKDLEEK